MRPASRVSHTRRTRSFRASQPSTGILRCQPQYIKDQGSLSTNMDSARSNGSQGPEIERVTPSSVAKATTNAKPGSARPSSKSDTRFLLEDTARATSCCDLRARILCSRRTALALATNASASALPEVVLPMPSASSPTFAHLDRRHPRGNIRPHVLLNEWRPADVTRKSVRRKSKQIKPRLRRPVSSYPFWLRHLPDGHLFTRIRTRIPSAAVDEFLCREPNSVLNGRHSSAEEQVAR